MKPKVKKALSPITLLILFMVFHFLLFCINNFCKNNVIQKNCINLNFSPRCTPINKLILKLTLQQGLWVSIIYHSIEQIPFCSETLSFSLSLSLSLSLSFSFFLSLFIFLWLSFQISLHWYFVWHKCKM